MNRRTGWVEVKLSDIAHLSTGNTPSKKVSDNYGGIIPFIKPPDLQDRKINTASDTLSEKGVKGARLLPENAVLVSCIGNLGKTGISGSKLAFNQQINAIEAYSGIDPRFIFYQTQSQDFKNQLEQLASATTISIVNKGNFSRIKVWIPPTSEQHRIVAKIEELFSELDKGIESLKRAREQLKVYRQALLKHAFEGKLTEQWRKDNADKLETADQLLTRIKHAREDFHQQQLEEWKIAVKQWESDGKERKKPTKPKGLTSFRDINQNEQSELSVLPSNWAWTRFENLIEFVTSGSRGWAKYYSPSGVTFIRAQNLKHDYLDLTDIAYVSLPESVEGKRTQTKQNDLLITITGANVTKSAHVVIEMGEAYVSQHVALSRLVNKEYAKYLFLFLISNAAGRRQLEKAAYGAGKPGLNLDNIKDLIVPISSTCECDVVTEIIEEKLSVVDDQIKGINFSLSKSESLRQSILKKAFSGQLVAQDPNDEPASVLLERIAAEKTQAAAQRKKPRANKKKPAMKKAD
ncbi:MAG: restriction endonuclease subunit S [Candidatus Thiodiazotropha taylori]|nr:restriction endonuclease subunit S [Candidatus Thiodiazotropha taylori]